MGVKTLLSEGLSSVKRRYKIRRKVRRQRRGLLADLLRALGRFEGQLVEPWSALRGAFGITAAVGAGAYVERPGFGLAAGFGALMAANCDSSEPYATRLRRMLSVSLLSGVAVVVGAAGGGNIFVSSMVAACGGFAAGLAVIWGVAAANIGVGALTLLVIFAARPMTLADALMTGCLALSGGLMQTGLAIFFWPIDRFRPERDELSRIYKGLAELALTPLKVRASPAGSDLMSRGQGRLAALHLNPGGDALRYRSILAQAERLRLHLLALARYRRRLQAVNPAAASFIAAFQQAVAESLTSIALLLKTPDAAPADEGSRGEEWSRKLHALSQSCEELPGGEGIKASLVLMNSISGQVRAARQLAMQHVSEPAFKWLTLPHIKQFRFKYWLHGLAAAVRSHLNTASPVFRHALRLAVCIAFGEWASLSFAWERSYWLPMTIALVLKPDYASTLNRVLLRITGSILGLLFATGLYHLLRPVPGHDLMLLASFMFLMRWLGPANYGLLTFAVSGLVVALLASYGTDPDTVVVARALNTAAAGIVAFVAVRLWPTWEGRQLPKAAAAMFEALRKYAEAVLTPRGSAAAPTPEAIDRLRLACRIARTDLTSSIDRLRLEPRTNARQKRLLSGILASTHRFAHALMALEAAGVEVPAAAVPVLNAFTVALAATLDYLRGAFSGQGELLAPGPNLRALCDELARTCGAWPARTSPLHVEIDRLTNSLNTMVEQVQAWRQLESGRK